MASNPFLSVNYKVFGRVQGVFFRRDTKATADQHGLVGWVRNESDGTVAGVVQGPVDRVRVMKTWLSTVGSRSCKIEKCEFTNERKITKLDYSEFKVKK